jgi:hypothetical protein
MTSNADTSEAHELMEEVKGEGACTGDAIDAVGATVSAAPARQRKGLAAVIGVLFSMLLMLGVVTGYLDAEAMGKCGECLRSVTSTSSSPSTAVGLQNASYVDDALRAIAT